MRYMDLEGHTLRSMDTSGYRHNYGGFYKKFIYQMSINRRRTTTTKGAHANVVRILSFILKSLGEDI